MTDPLSIKCPKCGEFFEPSEAFRYQIGEELLSADKAVHEKELVRMREETVKSVTERLAADTKSRMERLARDAEEEKERNKRLLKQLEELSADLRAFRRKDEERGLEMKKTLANEESKIWEDARKKALEEHDLKDREKDQNYSVALKKIEELKTKLQQGSQQAQGEVLELNIEQLLHEGFLDDEIAPIGKGAMGADIIHKVKGKSGKVAGVILWETKHAKWTPSWLPKLREDARNEDATVAVLVTANLPNDIADFQLREGVIVCAIKYVLPLASILRRSLLQIAVAKQTAATKEESLEQLFTYLQSETFRHRFEAFAEGVEVMRDDLAYERRVMERVWKKREGQIIKMSLNASRMYGELQGVMGNALPDIKLFALPDGDPLEESDREG